MSSTPPSARFFAASLALTLLAAAHCIHAQPATSGCIADRTGTMQCPPPGGACLLDLHGEVKCSPPDGGILLDRYRQAVCGPGQCITTKLSGENFCSTMARGAAALNQYGEAVCTGGCVSATAQACVTPSK